MKLESEEWDKIKEFAISLRDGATEFYAYDEAKDLIAYMDKLTDEKTKLDCGSNKDEQ